MLPWAWLSTTALAAFARDPNGIPSVGRQHDRGNSPFPAARTSTACQRHTLLFTPRRALRSDRVQLNPSSGRKPVRQIGRSPPAVLVSRSMKNRPGHPTSERTPLPSNADPSVARVLVRDRGAPPVRTMAWCSDLVGWLRSLLPATSAPILERGPEDPLRARWGAPQSRSRRPGRSPPRSPFIVPSSATPKRRVKTSRRETSHIPVITELATTEAVGRPADSTGVRTCGVPEHLTSEQHAERSNTLGPALRFRSAQPSRKRGLPAVRLGVLQASFCPPPRWLARAHRSGPNPPRGHSPRRRVGR